MDESKLKEALEPFAKAADTVHSFESDYDVVDGLSCCSTLRVGDLRRAKEAYDSLQSPVATVSDGVREARLIRLLDEAIHLISVGEENHGDEERWIKQAKMAAGWEEKN